MNKSLLLMPLLLFAATSTLPAAENAPGVGLPESKRTVLGLYVTAEKAYQKWKADPDGVKILDVRTPEEYIFVGHPSAASNVPLMFLQYKWNTQRKAPVMTPNRNFVAEVRRTCNASETILVICRSGARSAKAVNVLAEAGFRKLYNVTDGFEGDTEKDPASPSRGKRTKNGWKNAQAPWTYSLSPELMYLPED